MSEEDLELLITLDDPPYAPEEDTFHHLQIEDILMNQGATQESVSLERVMGE